MVAEQDEPSNLYPLTKGKNMSTTNTIQIPLTAHHIRFTARVETPIHFNDFKGSALRGSFTNIMQRTFCPQWRADETDPQHLAFCPVCQLLAVEQDMTISGDVRRPYSIEPPLNVQNDFRPGESFQFSVNLYGDKLGYIPYLVLAAGGMGEMGVGRKNRDGERGRFSVIQIDAVNPLNGETLTMMTPDERLVHDRTLPVNHAEIEQVTERLLAQLAQQDNQLRIRFLTPTRIVSNKQTLKQPDFFPLCKQVVLRVMDLCAQHGAGRPDVILKRDIYGYADQVKLVRDNSTWWDVQGYSGRLERKQVLGGLIGEAVYHSPDWRPLLPWLLWGMSTHVGKNIVKGCGIYEVGL